MVQVPIETVELKVQTVSQEMVVYVSQEKVSDQLSRNSTQRVMNYCMHSVSAS